MQQESIQGKLKGQKEEEANIRLEIDAYDKELKLFATKKNTLMTRIEECNENICKLGPLPLQEQTKYQNVGTVQVSMHCTFEHEVRVCLEPVCIGATEVVQHTKMKTRLKKCSGRKIDLGSTSYQFPQNKEIKSPFLILEVG